LKTRRLYLLLAFVTSLLLIGCSQRMFTKKDSDWRSQPKAKLSKIDNWTTYYGPYSKAPIIAELNDYDMVVLGWMDKTAQDIPKKPIVIQYLAVVEAGPNHRKYYDWLAGIDKDEFRLFDNPSYPDAWVIDIRNQEWHDLIIEQAIPWTMDHGGRGLMLDTFGNISLLLGNRSDFRTAAITLIKRIRATYPNLVLLVNEPGDLLPEVYQYIDGIIFEQYMANIVTGELYDVPRSSWGNQEVASAIQFRDGLLVEKDFLWLTCDMVKDDNLDSLDICVNRALSDGFLPTLTPFSTLGERYHRLYDKYLSLMKNR
jgi:hypothetical protein